MRCCAARCHSTPGGGPSPIRIASWCPPGRATAQQLPILGRFLALEYGGDDLDRLLTLAEGDRPAIGVLSQTTAGDLGRSARWRELYHPHGIGDELRLALFADDYCWVT